MIGSLNSIQATAEKLSIPQLQQAMRDGTLPPYVGIPLLQKKVQMQKQMQMASQSQQPKKPSIAEQVNQEATADEMMRQRARMMQAEMGQTGGISDFLPKGEESYAKGGPIAFANGTYGEDIRTQLQRLLDEQRVGEYGWSEEAAKAYEPKYYQTPAEARESMSRRGLAPAEQPMTLEELKQAQVRAKAQTGLGVRSGETIEVPPYKEPVSIRPAQPSTSLATTGPRKLYGEPTVPSANIAPYAYEGDVLGATRPSARPVSGLLPNYSPVIEGRSFVHPSVTPRADIEAAKAYYAETKGTPRPMAASDELAQKRAATKAAEDAALGRTEKLAQFEKNAAKTANLKTTGSYGLGAVGALSLPSYIEAVTGGDPRDFVSPERRSAIALEDARREEKLKRLGHTGMLLESLGLRKDEPDAYVGASEKVAALPATPVTKIQSMAYVDLPQGAKDMADRIATGRPTTTRTPTFDFANPNQVATDVLANPARANTDPDLWKWATDYRVKHPQRELTSSIQTPYAQAVQAAPVEQALAPQVAPETILSAAERAKQFKEALGEDVGRADTMKRLAEREAATAKQEERAPWLGLMQAGLATMAGTSPFAMANIGAGGVAGLNAYMKAQDKLDAAKENHDAILAQLNKAQRAEDVAAYKFGADSEQADKALAAREKLLDKELKARAELNQADIVSREKIANIQANAGIERAGLIHSGAGGVDSGVKADRLQTTQLKAYLGAITTKMTKMEQAAKANGELDLLKSNPNYIGLLKELETVSNTLRAKAIPNASPAVSGATQTPTIPKSGTTSSGNTYRVLED